MSDSYHLSEPLYHKLRYAISPPRIHCGCECLHDWRSDGTPETVGETIEPIDVPELAQAAAPILEPVYGTIYSRTVHPVRAVFSVYLDRSYSLGVKIPPGAHPPTPTNCFGLVAFDYGRVCGLGFSIAPSPHGAHIRLYGVPWGHAALRGASGWNDGRGNVYVAQTWQTGGAWLPKHVISIVKHEIGHSIFGMVHSPLGIACAMTGEGRFLPVVYHGRNDWWLTTYGIAGFTHRYEWHEVLGLQRRFGHPIFGRTR